MSMENAQRDIIDLARETYGARITMATTNHSKFSSSNIIDGVYNSFWATGGLFPEQFVISLQAPSNIDSIQIRCYNVKLILVERCTTVKPGTFEEVVEKELEHEEGHAQDDILSTEQLTACHLRFTIKDGYDAFCAVYQVRANGSISDGSTEMNTTLSAERFKNQYHTTGTTKLTNPAATDEVMPRDQTPFPFVPKDGGGYMQRRRGLGENEDEVAAFSGVHSMAERLMVAPGSSRSHGKNRDSDPESY